MQQPSQRRLTRTRTGCLTCKTRRIKCDEGRPLCLKCRKAGLKCSYAHLRNDDPVPPENALVRSLAQFPGSDRITAATPELEYFCRNLAPANIPHTSLLIYNLSPLLDRTGSEPMIADFLSAMSLSHRAFWGIGNSSTSDADLSVAYYDTLGKAINGMTSKFADLEGLTMSLSSTLLGIAEMTRSSSISTSNEHYKGIAQVVSSRTAGILSEADVYTSVKGGELAMSMLRECDDTFTSSDPLEVGPSLLPNRFASVFEALNCLDNLLTYWVSTLARRQSPWMGAITPESIYRLLDRWDAAMRPLENNTLSTSEELRTLALLRANHAAAKAWIRVSIVERDRYSSPTLSSAVQSSSSPSSKSSPGRGSPASSSDKSPGSEAVGGEGEGINKDFTAVLQNCHAYMAANMASTALSVPTQHRQIGIVAPLFLVSCLAPLKQTRDEAMRLLDSADVYEGAWGSRIAWRIAEMVNLLDQLRQTKSRSGARAHESPRVRPQLIECSINSQAQTATLKLNFAEHPSTSFKSISSTFSAEDDYQACRRAVWPLEAAVRSFGILSSNSFPSPYLISTPALADYQRREAYLSP